MGNRNIVAYYLQVPKREPLNYLRLICRRKDECFLELLSECIYILTWAFSINTREYIFFFAKD